MNNQENELEPVFKCLECNRIYSNKSTLTRHTTYECGGVRRFPCSYCTRSFKRRDHVTSHVRHIHLKEGRQMMKSGRVMCVATIISLGLAILVCVYVLCL